jgi:hypothetical protein
MVEATTMWQQLNNGQIFVANQRQIIKNGLFEKENDVKAIISMVSPYMHPVDYLHATSIADISKTYN